MSRAVMEVTGKVDIGCTRHSLKRKASGTGRGVLVRRCASNIANVSKVFRLIDTAESSCVELAAA